MPFSEAEDSRGGAGVADELSAQSVCQRLDARPHSQSGQPPLWDFSGAVERSSDLPAHGRRGIGVLAEIHRLEDGSLETVSPVDAPDRRLEAVHHVAAAADLPRRPGSVIPARNLHDLRTRERQSSTRAEHIGLRRTGERTTQYRRKQAAAIHALGRAVRCR